MSVIPTALNTAPSQPRRRKIELDELIFGVIKNASAPVGAYAISHLLSETGNNVVPNQVYRTLARLVEDERIRRVECLTAFVVATAQHGMDLVCSSCHKVINIPNAAIRKDLESCAQNRGFTPSRIVVELVGHCDQCSLANNKA